MNDRPVMAESAPKNRIEINDSKQAITKPHLIVVPQSAFWMHMMNAETFFTHQGNVESVL
jgi:hypothetical protein